MAKFVLLTFLAGLQYTVKILIIPFGPKAEAVWQILPEFFGETNWSTFLAGNQLHELQTHGRRMMIDDDAVKKKNHCNFRP